MELLKYCTFLITVFSDSRNCQGKVNTYNVLVWKFEGINQLENLSVKENILRTQILRKGNEIRISIRCRCLLEEITQRETYPCTTFTTKNLEWCGLGSKSGIRGERTISISLSLDKQLVHFYMAKMLFLLIREYCNIPCTWFYKSLH